jgi:hypothetical protein
MPGLRLEYRPVSRPYRLIPLMMATPSSPINATQNGDAIITD